MVTPKLPIMLTGVFTIFLTALFTWLLNFFLKLDTNGLLICFIIIGVLCSIGAMELILLIFDRDN